jgi:Protein of unknown function (DUF1236)
MRSILIAASAALTTVVAIGLAAAQQTQPGPGEQPPANHQMEKTQPGQTLKQERSGQSAQAQTQSGGAMEQKQPGVKTQEGQQPPRSGQTQGQTAQPENRMGAGTETKTGTQKTENRTTARTGAGEATGAQTGQARPTTGQPSGTANANINTKTVQAVGNAHISNESASRISETLMATATPQKVNVNVNFGAVLPREVNLLPLPASVVQLVPEYRGYDYVVVNDEIVIVQPSTRQVVEIISTGGGQAMAAPAAAPTRQITLTEAQRRLLVDSVRGEALPQAQVQVANGATVPADVALAPVPQTVITQIPMIERYRLFLDNNQVVLVDPSSREVVDVVR